MTEARQWPRSPAWCSRRPMTSSRLVEPERILSTNVVDAKSALLPEDRKPTFTGFSVVARLESLPLTSCATAEAHLAAQAATAQRCHSAASLAWSSNTL